MGNMFGGADIAEPDDLMPADAQPRQEHRERMNTTVRLDRETVKQIKIRAAAEGIRPNALMERAILRYLGQD